MTAESGSRTMLYRRAHAIAALAAFFLMGLWTAPLPADDGLASQRALYPRALAALAEGRAGEFASLKERLRDYPLYPYLEYREYQAHPQRLDAGKARAFVGAYRDSPLADRLLRQWLERLRREGRDKDFVAFFDPGVASVEQRCHYYLLNYRAGDRATAIVEGLALWRQGKSQPNGCNPLFERLIADGHVDEQVAWQRFVESLLNHEYRLANYVTRFFTSDGYRQRARTLLAVDRTPRVLADAPLFDDGSPEALAVIAHGIAHLAGDDAILALDHWKRYSQRHSFPPEDLGRVVSALVRNLFSQGHGLAADNLLRESLAVVNPSVLDWRLQQAIRGRDWQAVATWTGLRPPTLADHPRWRYWRARGLALSGQGERHRDEIQTLYQGLAAERTFYGFLASETLGLGPTMAHRPVNVTDAQVEALAGTAPFLRIAELRHHNDLPNARREWQFHLRDAPQDNWLTAARLVHRWEWHHQAITSMIQADYWDDVEIRFPLAFRVDFERSASATGIPLQLLFAVSRQESSFEPTIVSPAGARGLMQLMPATARETAHRHGLPYRGERDLDDPGRNIQLGSRYYRQMLDRYGNNRILATAAYNAGPGRVDRWLRQSAGTLPYDAWIETIPFTETRNYVQNVLAFSMIFAHHLQTRAPLLSEAERGGAL